LEIRIVETIVCVITLDRDAVGGGGAPIVYAKNEEERERMAEVLSRTMDAMVHDLGNGVYVLIKH